MKRLLSLLFFVAVASGLAQAQGTCSNFAGAVCPASVPSGVTHFYFIDYVGGSDSNSGASEAAPFQHIPCGANATSTAASKCTSASGTGWIFKGGVTVDFHSWPANVPFGGSSGAPTYMGPDPGWFTGGSWARPIFNASGYSGILSQDPLSDQANHTSFITIDNLEFTGLTITGTCSSSNANNCGYIAQYAYSGSDVSWEIKNSYAHGWTVTGADDPGNQSSLFWAKQQQSAASSIHDNVIDGSDSSKNCCNAMASWNEYNNYISFVDNAVFGDVLFFHDNTIVNMVAPGGAVHGNCIHLFGSASITELIYNNLVECLNTSTGDALFLVEEDAATIYAFNNVEIEDGQGNGQQFGNNGGTGASHVFLSNNTVECGTDPTPASNCINVKSGTPNITGSDDFYITNNNNQKTVTFVGSPVFSFPSPLNTSPSCAGGVGTTTNFGAIQICAPIGSGNGTGNLNITQTYPFAPLDSTAATTVGTGQNNTSTCTTIAGLNSAAGTACLSDTTLGVAYNSTSHTVSSPNRTPIAHSVSGVWENGAYESGYVLTVTATLGGTINDTGGSIVNCTSTSGVCSATYAFGTADTLTAFVNPGYSFVGWSGACSGVGPCSVTLSANTSITATFSTGPLPPAIGVNNNEGNVAITSPTFTINFPSTGTGGSWTCTPTNFGPYTSGSESSLQQAFNDAEACRTANSGAPNILLKVPPALYSSTYGPYLNQTSTSSTNPTGWIAVISTLDANLPVGQTVCAHGIQDNLATSTDVGLNNPDCTGQNMYYALGPKNVSGVISGITTLSTNTTTLAAIASTGTQCVALANGYVAPGVAEVVDTGANQETVTTTSASNQTGMCGNFTKTHASGVSVTFCASGCSYTLANGNAINTSNYDDVSNMYTLECTAANCDAVRACTPIGGGSTSTTVPACGAGAVLGPRNWLIEDAEIRPVVGGTSSYTNVQMNGSGSETTASQFTQGLHFRKVLNHGDWTSLASGANQISNAFYVNATDFSILDSQVSQQERPANEGHSILYELTGPLKIDHNWLEGNSSGIFTGGEPNNGVPLSGSVTFQDCEIRRNRETWVYPWLGLLTISGNLHGWNGSSLDRKNTDEKKSGERCVFDGNIYENSDNSGGQLGVLIDFNVRNCSSGTGCGTPTGGQNYQFIISDFTVTHNVYRNGCEGLEWDKSSANSGAGVTYGIYRMLFAENLMYDVTTTNPGCSGTASRSLAMTNSQGHYWQGTVTENAAGTAATFVANCSVDYGTCPGQIASIAINSPGTGCTGNGNATVSAPNIAGGLQFSASYTCSAGALATVTMTSLTGSGILAGSGYTSVPTVTPATGTGTFTVTLVSSATAPPSGAEVLDIATGDPAAITMCSTSALNNVTTATFSGLTKPNEVAPSASPGSAPWTGTPIAANLTVSYPWTATANLSDTSGFCTITSVQGGPANLQFQHNTLVTDSSDTLTSNNIAASGGNYQINTELRDSIMLGGGWDNIGEGTPTEKFNYDIGSMTADHLVWPTRTSSLYTFYGHNPTFPVASPIMYFPSTNASVGFACSGCSSSVPLTLADYHGYGLTPGGTFAAGGTDQASDGTDMGAAMSAIDAAQTANLGSFPGAFPDVPPAGTFSCTPATVPAHHSANLALTCTGVGTSWSSGTVFTVSSPATFVSSSNSSATVETVTITTSSGTGTSTITDTTDSISTTIAVATGTLVISPTSGNTGTTPTLTLTGTNAVWTHETASTLFSLSGGTGASLGTPTVTSDTSATVVLTVGSAAGTLTITDNSTTATATFTATSPSVIPVAPAAVMIF
jgi:hypothetical protein